MLQVPNQLSENPGLVRVRDAPVNFLHHRFGEHLRPGHVVQIHSAEPSPVDGRRMAVVPDDQASDLEVDAARTAFARIGLSVAPE